MQIFLGYDHAGHSVRDAIIKHLQSKGHTVSDLGNQELVPDDDYPDFAEKVGTAVLAHKESRGILLCGSGVGVCIAANKIKGIRAGFAASAMQAASSIRDDDANILCLGARVHHVDDLLMMVDVYLEHTFAGGRHERRREKVIALENS